MKIVLRIIPVGLLLLFTTLVNAQIKIGHINSQELLAAMPESDSAQKKLEKLAKEHELAIEEMTVEFNKKYEVFMNLPEDASDLVKTSKQAELEDLQRRIAAYEQSAQQDIQQKRVELFRPIQEKAINAVNQVAEELGFTYILDEGVGVIVYAAPNAENILPQVKEKLGLP